MIERQKCVLFCDKSCVKIVTTTKKGHLFYKQLAKHSSTTLYPRVPKNVSDTLLINSPN